MIGGIIDSYCVGNWEKADPICNGYKKGKTRKDRRPCAWKKRCKAFKKYLKIHEKKPRDFLKISQDKNGESFAVPKMGLVKFKEFCDKLLATKKKSTQSDKPDARKLGPSDSTKRAAAKALKIRAKERKRLLMGIFTDFRSTLSSSLKSIRFATPGSVVVPGELYLINKIDSSKYISLYCKVLKGRDVPIVSFKTKTASLTFDAKIPLTVEELEKNISKSAFKMLAPREEAIGRFKSVARHLDQEKIILLAEVVAKLISSGKIHLSVL